MESKILKFETDGLKILEQDDTIMLGVMDIVTVGRNVNMTDFPEEVINECKHTLMNKPIVCIFDKGVTVDNSDFTNHAHNEYDVSQRQQVGVIPESCEMQIVEKYGRKILQAKVAFWKHYCPDICEKLAKNEKDGLQTHISMEVLAEDGYTDEDGYFVITKFTFMAISLLGIKVQQGITEASLNIVKFDLNNAIRETNKILSKYEIPSQVKENAKQALSLKQKNPKLISIAKEIVNNKALSFSKIESIKDKIEHLRKEENLIFYGGQECKEWCNKILSYEKGDEEVEKEEKFETPVDEKEVNAEKTEECSKEEQEIECEKTEDEKVECEKQDDTDEDKKDNEEENKEVEASKQCDEEKSCFELKISELETELSNLKKDFELANTELAELRTYKANKEEEERKANLKFEAEKVLKKEEFSGMVTEEEVTNLFETVLYEKGLDAFTEKLSALVLPKMFAKQKTMVVEKEVEQHYSAPFIADVQKEEQKLETSWQRAEARVKTML